LKVKDVLQSKSIIDTWLIHAKIELSLGKLYMLNSMTKHS